MRYLGISALMALLILCGCNSKVIQSVALSPGQTPVLGQALTFDVKGQGACSIHVDWGDRDHDDKYVDLTSTGQVSHTYNGWAGGKTVTVTPNGNGCIGNARVRFRIDPSVKQIAFDLDSNPAHPRSKSVFCFTPSPGLPDIAPMSLVHISSPPNPKVNFGSGTGGPYTADGNPNPAPPPFPFPGLRQYSLVLEVDADVFQGGTNTQFTTTKGGTLQFCENDFDASDDQGGWRVDVTVDQLGPVLN